MNLPLPGVECFGKPSALGSGRPSGVTTLNGDVNEEK